MSDTLTRVKLQLRPVNGSVLNNNGNSNGDDKTPTSPTAKLLINHGKPNYTIQRTPKAQQNGGSNPLTNDLQNNNRNNYYPYKSAGVVGTTGIVTNGYTNKTKITTNNGGGGSSNSSQNGDDLVIQSTKFNGVFKAANVQQIESRAELDNKVVLRRVQRPTEATAPQNSNEENVPEFILRQRRIQERLAKENLDFENRRSGYFTHVVISPTSPNRTSMMETMSSPPIVPSLEMPPPTKEASIVEESNSEVSAAHANGGEEKVHEQNFAAKTETNGRVEEEEVAKAIEEVNKAVAGETDDDKVDTVEEAQQAGGVLEAEHVEVGVEAQQHTVEEHQEAELKEEEHKPEAHKKEGHKEIDHTKEEHKKEEHKLEEVKEEEHKEDEQQHVIAPVKAQEPHAEQPQLSTVSIVVTRAPIEDVGEEQDSQSSAVEPQESITAATEIDQAQTEHAAEVVVVHNDVTVEPPKSPEATTDVEITENGHSAETASINCHSTEEVTISHTNDLANGISSELLTPSLPKPDPSGALGVNYEPKTVVSFSRDLGAPNNYPDTVQVAKTHEEGEAREAAHVASDELKELAKLKFDIKANDKDVQVTPVLRAD